MEAYRKQHIAVHRAETLKATDYVIAAIMDTLLERPDGEQRYFGAWLVAQDGMRLGCVELRSDDAGCVWRRQEIDRKGIPTLALPESSGGTH